YGLNTVAFSRLSTSSGFNERRVLTTVTKLRINFQVSADGKTLTGTTEAVVLDRDGKVISTFPGATNSAVRLRLRSRPISTHSRRSNERQCRITSHFRRCTGRGPKHRGPPVLAAPY